ncbi:Protein HYPER-SENSITIVITY-RELATED 4 [Camellia lanceoleosa]|uniref:Protein HYPER-SENSITIVITY-RELATED 4 n=1 Tax=Camellia lanceoleosa TaxID=1840588 RepID=A0ACC0G6B7_9ERIC|nr:Protein HYPER-SENSITIVITY-RELATED 4 [Camellia lanceoleosa]
MPSTTSVLSTYTTFAASAMLVRTVLNEVQTLTNQLIPQQLQEKILSKLGLMGNFSSSQMTLVIDEFNGFSKNEMFEVSEMYLRAKISPSVARLKVSKAARKRTSLSPSTRARRLWIHLKISNSFGKPYVLRPKRQAPTMKAISLLKRSKAIKEENKVVKLYSLGNFYGEYDGGAWGSVNLDHPSTFDTLAMDPTLKKELIDDLDRFVKRRKFYKRIGKAWKRGYLLYGPPGTGKSSLIAAMANYLKFHIYDLELTSLQSNSELRRLLVATANRSILVIEDIDCSSDFENRQVGGCNQSDSQLTLSGLLNFIDGLWSSCGDERIIVFTTNHKDRLDPALLRPGRMDMHIHMSYCTPSGFKILATNYLGLNNHSMFTEIEKLITEVEVTPAEIAEELMKSEEADKALEGLIKFLHKKKREHEEAQRPL